MSVKGVRSCHSVMGWEKVPHLHFLRVVAGNDIGPSKYISPFPGHDYWKREFAPEHFSAIVLTKGAAAHNLRDPLAAQEDVSVVCHRGLESLVRRNLSFAAKEALKIARSHSVRRKEKKGGGGERGKCVLCF